MTQKFSHLDPSGNPVMVDVTDKNITQRTAIARSIVILNESIVQLLKKDEIHTKKGPVFQTAITAGIMAAKKTSELIPLCHQLPLDSCSVNISVTANHEIEIICTAKTQGKTGVEMEALTGASIAALTIYDMCKGFSQDIVISDTKLIEKKGGKSDYKRS